MGWIAELKSNLAVSAVLLLVFLAILALFVQAQVSPDFFKYVSDVQLNFRLVRQ